MRIVRLGCASIVLLTSALAVGAESTWELRGNHWIEVRAEAPTTAPVAQPALDRAERMLRAGSGKAAAQAAVEWIRAHPKDAPQRDRALMILAEGKFQDDKRIEAFYYLDQLLDEHPESVLYAQALQRQYDIADAFLAGHNRVFLFLPILGAEDEAIDMLFGIQQRAPGSPLAEKAMLRTADYYYASSDFELASDVYAAFLRSYPRSPEVPAVRLRRAYSTLAQFRGTRYDATPLIDAQAQMADLRVAYPDMAEDQNLADLMGRIDQTFARKLIGRAQWYKRTKRPSAAVYSYRYLIISFPKTSEAAIAKRRLEAFSPKLLAAPWPRAGEGYAPAMELSIPEELPR